MNQATILALERVSKVYPGTLALQDVDLAVRRGEVHGIVGKNGAGKSTLVGIVSGLIPPSSGRIRLKDKTYPYLTPALASRAGVAIVPQEPQVVGEATAAENLFMPRYPTRGRGLWVDWKRLFDEAQRIFDRAQVPIDARFKVKDLPIGLQQLLLIVKACYVADADVIILDEASSSLPEKDKQTLYNIVRAKRDEGRAILYITHSIDELLEICDRLTVLRDGVSVATVERRDVDKDKLASLIVGETFQADDAAWAPGPRLRVNGRAPKAPDPAVPAAPAADGPAPAASGADGPAPAASGGVPLLAVEGLTRTGRFYDITFQVHRGEIVGLAGLLGSGRTEIQKAIAAIEPAEAGTIRLDGRIIKPLNPAQALAHGIVYLPEDRDEEGLITSLDVRTNVTLSSLPQMAEGPFLKRAREDALVHRMVQRLQIKLASYDQEVKQLSGGNRQKVVFARIAATEPRVVLLDEPTKGIDIAARRSVLEFVRHELSRQAAVVMSAPGLEDLIAICDRILVLWKGRIVQEVHRDDFDERRLYKAIQGA
ncbi:MAG TPA: sugar ABC transporter ATP-binding protein [Limnochordales bacterium]|nr:sugar ABC transporter ATP-binding protein [Limnochordales bacterium]